MKKHVRSAVGSVGLFLFLAAAVWPLGAAAPTARPEDVGMSSDRLRRIHELVQRHLDAKSFSGAVTLVARDGRIAHLEAHGLMDLESKKPMATDGIFRIMSMTKPVVGAAILMLVEEGKVRITDPVSRFIPELKGLKVAVTQPQAAAPAAAATPAEPRFYTIPGDREITVKDLLTHTSGLVSGTVSGREAGKVALKGKETLADYLPRLGGVPLEFQPGSRWAYSAQAGFDALLRIVEVASGMPADRFLKTRLFDPLGMKDTFFYPAEGNPRMVTLYRRTPQNGLEKQDNPGFMNGAYFSGGGGLMSTAADYLQFAQMLLNGGQLNGKRFLAPRTVELMRSAFIPDTLPGRVPGEGYGLSVRVVTNPIARNTFISQGSFGWSGAYGTYFWIDPEKKLVGILMTQTANQEIRPDFESAVMQALVEPVPGADGRDRTN
jgi:CubicO group peptidase (beta-lactamase class C family)